MLLSTMRTQQWERLRSGSNVDPDSSKKLNYAISGGTPFFTDESPSKVSLSFDQLRPN